MNQNQHKPRLVFFQNKYDDGLPEFLLMHVREHVKCLSVFFDVTVIRDDCDYQQICDAYQPDLTLFESGVNLLTCRMPKIANARSNQKIPKLGLLNADAWCETRSGSLSELDHWGVETIFSIAATAVEHMPAIADRLFVWPNFVDPEIYHDYGEAKMIPVLLSGATAAQYPWRRRLYKLIAEHYPAMSCPHRGYLSRAAAGQVLYGERNARTINASQVAPVCGTVAGEVVRKHFEIPACNTCLITERTPHVEDAGFVDMTNCVFADESDVLDKLEFLFKDPEQLRRITAAGHDLVHSRHTMNQRDQMLQWFRLQQNLSAGERIVQASPFAPLAIAGASTHESASLVPVLGAHLQMVRDGDEKLWTGQLGAAEGKYKKCLSYMHRLPEARFKIALTKLYSGNAADANTRIFELIQYSLSNYKAVDPDPIEWAYYIISLLCMGKEKDAARCADEFPWLRHPELERVRRLMAEITHEEFVTFPEAGSHRASIHQLPARSEAEWREDLYGMLRACGQDLAVERIASIDAGESIVASRPESFGSLVTFNDSSAKRMLQSQLRQVWPGVLSRRLLHYSIRRKLRNLGGRLANISAGAGGPAFGATRKVESPQILAATRDVARDLGIRTALLGGGRLVEDVAKAIREGSQGGETEPLIYSLSETAGVASKDGDRTHDLKGIFPLQQVEPSQQALHRLKREQGIAGFDLVLLTGPDIHGQLSSSHALCDEILSARYVMLAESDVDFESDPLIQLLRESTYVLLECSSDGRGYVILRRKASVSPGDPAALLSNTALPCIEYLKRSLKIESGLT